MIISGFCKTCLVDGLLSFPSFNEKVEIRFIGIFFGVAEDMLFSAFLRLIWIWPPRGVWWLVRPAPDFFMSWDEFIMLILRLAYFGPSPIYALTLESFFSRTCILGGSSKLSTSDDDSSEESLIPYCFFSSFSSYFFFLSLIAEVLSTWSKASMITARMTFSRKNDPTTTNRIQNPIAIHA